MEVISAIHLLGRSTDSTDSEFLFRMKNLVELELFHPIDIRSIRRVLQKLKFLQVLLLSYPRVRVEKSVESPKRFKVHIDGTNMETCDLKSVIWLIEQTIKIR